MAPTTLYKVCRNCGDNNNNDDGKKAFCCSAHSCICRWIGCGLHCTPLQSHGKEVQLSENSFPGLDSTLLDSTEINRWQSNQCTLDTVRVQQSKSSKQRLNAVLFLNARVLYYSTHNLWFASLYDFSFVLVEHQSIRINSIQSISN